MKKVIVVGGGAAGMMAAAAAAETGHSVLLLEKNEKLGKKLFITGKGRCNVTNDCEMDTLFENCMSNAKFLYSAFYAFDNHALMNLLEETGCRLKVERGGRVFPVSDHSSDVIGALKRLLDRGKVAVRLNTEVKRLLKEAVPAPLGEDGPLCKVTGVELADGTRMKADAVVVATGGASYPLTGSTGDGYRFAEDTGHKVSERRPSLVPFTVAEEWCRELMGLSLRNVAVSLHKGKKPLYGGFGEMLFTHFGVSGPLILSASSSYVQRAWGERAQLAVDLKPALDEEQLDRRILRDFEENRNRQFKNALGGLLPARLIPVMVMLSGVDPDRKVHEITRQERKHLADKIKALPLTVTGVRGMEEAIITKGGVSVRDVNPSTMESKKAAGLYFAGEVLDLDALTGGFNLQIAWSTGHLAGLCKS